MEACLRSSSPRRPGVSFERDRDMFGRTVNLASRISAAAQPGEVLVSDAMVRAAGKGRFRFEPAGARELKGFAEPVPVFRVVAHPGPAT